jgi:hypothetical protein
MDKKDQNKKKSGGESYKTKLTKKLDSGTDPHGVERMRDAKRHMKAADKKHRKS